MTSKDFTNWDNLSIAPSRYGGDWTVAKYKAIAFNTESDWQTAIDIFEDRIIARFFDVVKVIEHMPYAGFSVMALDCLLIETLEQTRQGEPETPYGKGENYFVNFLTQTDFKTDFDNAKAKKFYQHIRNGILHQAETKGSSRIRTDKDLTIAQDAPDGNGLIINRREFHQKLKCIFEKYVAVLRNPSNKSERESLQKKMDAICHFQRTK